MSNARGALGIHAVSHVSVCVSDMERAVEFYREVLGFEVLFDQKLDGPALDETVGQQGAHARAVGGRVGAFNIELLEQSYVPSEPRPPGLGLNVLTFQVDDIDAAYAKARALGYECESPPIDWSEQGGTRLFFLVGPDQQRIELVEYIPGGGAWGGTY